MTSPIHKIKAARWCQIHHRSSNISFRGGGGGGKTSATLLLDDTVSAAEVEEHLRVHQSWVSSRYNAFSATANGLRVHLHFKCSMCQEILRNPTKR